MRRPAITAAATVLLLIALAAPALASEAPGLGIRRVHYDRPVVEFSLTPPSGATTLTLVVDGDVVATRSVDASVSPVVIPARLVPGSRSVRADALFADGTAAEGAPRTVDTNAYRPQSHSAALAANQIVTPSTSVSGWCDKRTTGVQVWSPDLGTVWKGAVRRDASGSYRTGAFALPYDLSRLYVVAHNAWGTHWIPGVNVYQLGPSWTLPSLKSYVLVDKDFCGLYHIGYGRVIRAYPIAVGMGGTPTPEGYFVLGAAQRMWSGSDWGVLRRPLYRRTSWGLARTSYYIHGTNDPDSIGTWASHGCIRMYNSDVLTFNYTVSNGATVYIRR